MVSESGKSFTIKTLCEEVLILVVVEDGLGALIKEVVYLRLILVLILVVVEDGLGGLTKMKMN